MDERVSQIAVGVAHTLALTETGRIYSWGANTFSQLGHNSTAHVDRPRLVASLRSLPSPVAAVRCGSYVSVVITVDARVFSWGCGNKGVLGTGKVERYSNSNDYNNKKRNICSK